MFYIKLFSENKLKICAVVNLHYQISREKFEPETGLELGGFKGELAVEPG